MISIVISVEDEASSGLKDFGDHSDEMLDASLRGTARTFSKYIVQNYLSGQMLNKRTGKLQKDTHHRKSRRATHSFIVSSNPRLANIYDHPGGANIVPNTKKALRWSTPEGFFFSKHSHLAEKPFMPTAIRTFDFKGEFRRQADKMIAKAIKKSNLNV